MATIKKFRIPASLGGGFVYVKELTVEERSSIRERCYSAVKAEGDLVKARLKAREQEHQAALVGLKTGAGAVKVTDTNREEIWHGLGPKKVQLVEIAFARMHNVDEDDLEAFSASEEAADLAELG